MKIGILNQYVSVFTKFGFNILVHPGLLQGTESLSSFKGKTINIVSEATCKKLGEFKITDDSNLMTNLIKFIDTHRSTQFDKHTFGEWFNLGLEPTVENIIFKNGRWHIIMAMAGLFPWKTQDLTGS